MKLKPNYIIIPFITLIVAGLGIYYTSIGLNREWYKELTLPSWAPLDFIPIAWTIIFILTTISALIVWNKLERNAKFWTIIIIFLINAFLNVFWTYLFFYNQLIFAAIFECALLVVSVLALILLIFKNNKVASLLLLPYFLWTSFATYLTYTIWTLN